MVINRALFLLERRSVAVAVRKNCHDILFLHDTLRFAITSTARPRPISTAE